MADGKVAYYLELRDVYDGYSVTIYEDGTMENRWADYCYDQDDKTIARRREQTQEWIDAQKED